MFSEEQEVELTNFYLVFVAVFALIAQPMYGLVASQVANALGGTVTISSVTELRDAIKNQQDGQTWNIIAGNYPLAPFDDITAGGSHGSAQTGWYFPITANNLTINGAGSNNTTIYGTGYSPNGNWATQNFVSIFGNNVTLNNLTLMPKVDGNKVIEVMGNNSTINNVTVTPNTLSVDDYNSSPAMYREWYKRWGGSIYYNHAGTGHTISNTIINNGGISNHNSTLTISGVSLSHLLNNEFDYVYGNAVSEGGATTGTPKFIYHLNSEAGSVAATMPNIGVGDTIELDSNVTTNNQITLSESNVTLNGNGHTITNNRDNSLKDNSNNSAIGIQANGVTVNNLTIDGTGGKWMHGINAYEATGVALNSVTLQNSSNAGLIVGKDSNVTVKDITTKNNGWYGINVDKKAGTSSTLTVLGTSEHEEGTKAHIWIDDRNATGNTVNDPNAQYARYWEGNGYKYLLDRTKPTAELTIAPFNPTSFDIKATDDQRLTRIDYSIWKDNDSTQIGVWGHEIDWNDKNAFEKTFTEYCDHSGNVNNPCVFKEFADMPEGKYTLRAISTDVMGKSTNAETREFSVDRTAPAAPKNLGVRVTSNGAYVPNNGHTNQKFVTASWQNGANEDVTYIYNYWKEGHPTWNENNKWTHLTSATSYPGAYTEGEGAHKFCVIAVDMAGNKSACSATYTVTYDTTNPTNAAIAVGSTHSVQAGTRTGVITITGSAEDANPVKNHWFEIKVPGTSTLYYYHNLTSGDNKAAFNLTDAKDSAGNNLVQVDGEYSIRYVATDLAGNRSDNNGTTTTTFVVKSAPAAPVIDPIKSVTVGSPVVVTGKGVAGDEITVTLGVKVSQTIVNIDGEWTVSFTGIIVGNNHQVTAVAKRDGVSSNPSEIKIAVVNPVQSEDEPINSVNPQGEAPVPTAGNLGTLFLPVTLGALNSNDDDAVATPLLRTTSTADSDDDADVLGAEDVRADWSAVNAALAGFIAILAVVALAGIRRTETDNNTGARVFMLVPAAAAVIAFFLIEDIGGSMAWFNVWTWLFAGILVVQAIVATLTMKTSND